MSTTNIFILAVVVAGAIAAFGIIAVAIRRKDSEGAVTQAELDRKATRPTVQNELRCSKRRTVAKAASRR